MFLESLESRQLMSVSPFSTQVQQDRLAVQKALLNFRSDLNSYTATLLADCSALQSADVKQDSTLLPLFKQLHKDAKSMRLSLKEDRLNESSAVLKDESAVVAEESQFLSDAGNKTARAADRVQIREDRIQLQADEIAGLNARLTTRETDESILSGDITAITNALAGDTGASSALQAAVKNFVTDRTDSLSAFQTDIEGIITARNQLMTDLKASLTSTST